MSRRRTAPVRALPDVLSSISVAVDP